jgi:hypothetical protein
MKSLVMKSIYTGLGLLGSGKESVEELGRKLAKRANLSERDGEKIARQLRARSHKAVDVLHKTLESEVTKVVSAFRAATQELAGSKARSNAKKPAKRRSRTKRKTPARAAR